MSPLLPKMRCSRTWCASKGSPTPTSRPRSTRSRRVRVVVGGPTRLCSARKSTRLMSRSWCNSTTVVVADVEEEVEHQLRRVDVGRGVPEHLLEAGDRLTGQVVTAVF